MFSSMDLRGLTGQKIKIISDRMYTLLISYLNWKQCRSANEQIPDLIRHSIENIKPSTKENSENSFRNDFLNIYSRLVLDFKIICS